MKILGLHGFGNVGRFMAGIARGFGMKDYAYDPYIGDAAIKAATGRVCRSPEELYSTCQYVSIHIPANEKTKKSIGYDLMKLMPADAVFEEKYKDRFIFTAKKMGAQTEEANINAGVAAARQIVDYFKTGNEKFRVNN